MKLRAFSPPYNGLEKLGTPTGTKFLEETAQLEDEVLWSKLRDRKDLLAWLVCRYRSARNSETA